jgi:hypothetical protein
LALRCLYSFFWHFLHGVSLVPVSLVSVSLVSVSLVAVSLAAVAGAFVSSYPFCPVLSVLPSSP